MITITYKFLFSKTFRYSVRNQVGLIFQLKSISALKFVNFTDSAYCLFPYIKNVFFCEPLLKTNKIILGYGGQVDFIRGSAEGLDGKGKPIIALGSVNPKTKDERGNPSSKIVPTIKEGKIFYICCNL